MLQTLDSEICECYRHAAECSCSADQSRDSPARQEFLDMERRWLYLARGYEFAERLSNFSDPFKAENGKIPETASSAVPIISRRESVGTNRSSAVRQGSMNYAELI